MSIAMLRSAPSPAVVGVVGLTCLGLSNLGRVQGHWPGASEAAGLEFGGADSGRRSRFFGPNVQQDASLLAESWGGCGNNNTCDPAFCLYANGPGNTECPGAGHNASDASLAAEVAKMQSRTCTPSRDARCSASALKAVFGRFPAVKAVYCTDEFMVMHSSDLPNHGTDIRAIYTPPVGGAEFGQGGWHYKDQCVMLDYHTQHMVFKWPLATALLATSSGAENNADGFVVPSDRLYNSNHMSSLPSVGPIAVTVSGVPWFPNVNHKGGMTWGSCEVDVCNAHAGPHFDYHYHGDPFGPQCMYSAADYAGGEHHPPLVGYSFDGVPIFGRYLAEAPGFGVELDDCGGHQHAGMGDSFIADGTYHYHTFVQRITTPAATEAIDPTTGQPAWAGVASYVAHSNGPFMCWKGNISAIRNFWLPAKSDGSAYQASFLAGDLEARADYEQVRPCEGTADYYVAPGFAIPGAAAAPGIGPLFP